jgi:copper(I)-binding protein
VSRTARLPRRVLVPTALSLLAAASLVLSGCAAGQYSQTADQVAAIDGANGTVGDIAVLNARLAPTEREKYPAGSDARLLLWISNDGLNADELSGVSTSAADSVEIAGAAAVPGQTLADFATENGTEVTVTGFVQDLFYGNSIPVTFEFKNAGSLSLNIPIQIPEQRSTDRETIEILPPHPTPIWEEGLHGEAGEAGAAETGAAGGTAETTVESSH